MNKDAVFINCPFDSKYKPMLRVLIFVARFYGLEVKISLLEVDSKSQRLGRIIGLMKDAKYSIHDLSLLKAENKNDIFRMNMPFELGLDYGLNYEKDEKVFLVFESDSYKLKEALSDINGWDVRPHKNDPEQLILEFRKWILAKRECSKEISSFSSTEIWYIYNDFYATFTDNMAKHKMKEEEISALEFIDEVDTFLKEYQEGDD